MTATPTSNLGSPGADHSSRRFATNEGTSPGQPPPFSILVVEDSDDDLFLFRRLLQKAEITNPVDVATNGQAAIDTLDAMIRESEAPTVPRVIFLDLKLPLRSGFEVLEWVRGQSALAYTIVLVLSSSAEARDVKRAYELGAQGYLVKYPAPATFREIVRKVALHPPNAPMADLTFEGLPRPAE